MSFILTDPIQSMAVGAGGPPPGWTNQFDFGSTCFAFTDAPGGEYPQLNHPGQYHWYRNRASALISPDVTINGLKSFTIYFGFRIPSYQGPHNFLQLNCINTLGVFLPVFQLIFENDLSISALAGSGITQITQYPQVVGRSLLDNSGVIQVHPPKYYFSYDTWYYAQLDIGLIGNGTDPMKVSGDMFMNGIQILSWTATPFSVGSASFAGSAPVLGTIIFLNPGTLDLTQIFLATDASTLPAPGAPKIRESQAVIELAQLPTTGLSRVSQGVIELSQLPSNSHVRISQMVIELPPGPFGGNWQVKEA